MPLTETLPPRRKAAETAATAGTCVYCQVPLPDEARAIVRCGCGCGWVVFECRPAWKVGRGSPPPSRNWVAGPHKQDLTGAAACSSFRPRWADELAHATKAGDG